jgi:hypothetical protein
VQSTLAWGKKQDSISKITRSKRVGGMVQVIDCLYNMCEALNANPNITRKEMRESLSRIKGNLN